VLVYLGVCDATWKEGSAALRRQRLAKPAGRGALGTKVEIKTEPFRQRSAGSEFEVKRQTERSTEASGSSRRPRLWDADRGYTRSMRSKEFAHDYAISPSPTSSR